MNAFLPLLMFTGVTLLVNWATKCLLSFSHGLVRHKECGFMLFHLVTDNIRERWWSNFLVSAAVAGAASLFGWPLLVAAAIGAGFAVLHILSWFVDL
ncbi:MAG: hypothetical protein K2W82_11340 [Candidatus Obscuribacterales bacterium]|jgi:hypothetical protein|nr:hypothetical protein [Candidatus Obscuribacterales bacterium]